MATNRIYLPSPAPEEPLPPSKLELRFIYVGPLTSTICIFINKNSTDLSKSGLNGLTHPNTEVWLGLYAIETKTKFAWTDGTPLDYTKWGTGEPDGIGEDGASANCIDIHSDLVTGYEGLYETWDDNNCWVNMRAFVCKKPAYVYY